MEPAIAIVQDVRSVATGAPRNRCDSSFRPDSSMGPGAKIDFARIEEGTAGAASKLVSRRRGRRWPRTSLPRLILPLLLALGHGPIVRAQVEKMRILIPLYARPEGEFWSHMVDAAQNTTVQYSVAINPNSGPGDLAEDAYTQGMANLTAAGIEVLCYVATGFGETDINVVNADVDLYQSFYPDMCDGFFFDEGPGTAMYAYKYTAYYTHAQETTGPDTTVVVNPGLEPDESLYNIDDEYTDANPGMGGQLVIVSFENQFLVFDDGSRDYRNRQVPIPPRNIPDRYMHSILVYGAYFITLDEFLDFTVFQLYCENWGYVFFTDDSFGDDGNPWNDTPSYFESLLSAVAKADASADLCGTHAPTPAPTLAPTFSPIGDGETHPPLPTPAPTIRYTEQPGAIGQTLSPLQLGPTPAPTPSPTIAPTGKPTQMPTAAPSPSPTEPSLPTAMPVEGDFREEGSGARRSTHTSAIATIATVGAIVGGALLMLSA